MLRVHVSWGLRSVPGRAREVRIQQALGQSAGLVERFWVKAKAFEKYDSTKDGQLNIEELTNALKAHSDSSP